MTLNYLFSYERVSRVLKLLIFLLSVSIGAYMVMTLVEIKEEKKDHK